jgi:hypothetical protein
MRAGGALGRLLPCPLLPTRAAAWVDGPPPAPLLPALALPCPSAAYPVVQAPPPDRVKMRSTRVQWTHHPTGCHGARRE